MPEKLEQGRRFQCKAMAGGRLLLHHRGILLRSLIDSVDRLVDFGKSSGLFTRGFHDRHDVCVDIAYLRRNLLQGGARSGDEADTVFHLRAGCVDKALDFLRGRCGTLREFAHLLRDHGKPLARLTRARGFHTRIQGQQIGLESDLVNHADDIGNLARRFFDLVHRPDRIPHHRARMFGMVAGTGDDLSRLFRPAA